MTCYNLLIDKHKNKNIRFITHSDKIIIKYIYQDMMLKYFLNY